MKKYDGFMLQADDDVYDYSDFFEKMALGELFYLTPFYTHSKGDEEPEDEFLDEKRVVIIISAIASNPDCTLSIKFKVAEVHEAIECGEYTLVFDLPLVCKKIPDEMYVNDAEMDDQADKPDGPK